MRFLDIGALLKRRKGADLAQPCGVLATERRVTALEWWQGWLRWRALVRELHELMAGVDWQDEADPPTPAGDQGVRESSEGVPFHRVTRTADGAHIPEQKVSLGASARGLRDALYQHEVAKYLEPTFVARLDKLAELP